MVVIAAVGVIMLVMFGWGAGPYIFVVPTLRALRLFAHAVLMAGAAAFVFSLRSMCFHNVPSLKGP